MILFPVNETMSQLQVTAALEPFKLQLSNKLTHNPSFYHSRASAPTFNAEPNSKPYLKLVLHRTQLPLLRSRTLTLCKINKSDMMSQLELGKPEQNRKTGKRVKGIFWIILLNIGIFVADHFFQVNGIKTLYLYHNWPAWYQFVTATFCHANWKLDGGVTLVEGVRRSELNARFYPQWILCNWLQDKNQLS